MNFATLKITQTTSFTCVLLLSKHKLCWIENRTLEMGTLVEPEENVFVQIYISYPDRLTCSDLKGCVLQNPRSESHFYLRKL